MTSQSKLIAALALLNRKERFWLLRKAIGPAFSTLDADFRKDLSGSLGRDEDWLKEDAWWAFDYHLDWIAVALQLIIQDRDLTRLDGSVSSRLSNTDDCDQLLLQGSQQDVDLLVAQGSSLILVEAKAGTAWSRAQMDRKIKRLNALKNLADMASVDLQLVLCSPIKSTKVHIPKDGSQAEEWPLWALVKGAPNKIDMKFGDDDSPLFQVRRTDKQGGLYQGLEFVRIVRTKDKT